MKITEIDWPEGKKYKTHTEIWKVQGGRLILLSTPLKLTPIISQIEDVYTIKEILELDFEEVIEPVDFMTAYKDCLENGTKYKTEGATPQKLKKHHITKHVVIEVGEKDFNVLLECLWIKGE